MTLDAAKRRTNVIRSLIRRGLTADQAVHFEQRIHDVAAMALDGGLHAVEHELLSRAIAREIRQCIAENQERRS